MTDAAKMMSALRRVDTYSSRETALSGLNPLSHLVVTLGFIATVLSFDKYELAMLVPFAAYPFLISVLCGIPFALIAKRVLAVLPVAVLLGGFNPLFDSNEILFCGTVISAGWVSFFSLFIKCALTVSVALILICLIGIDGICAALHSVKTPGVIVVLLSFTYRYIHVLGEEAVSTVYAYKLRAPGARGVSPKQFGSMCGAFFLRCAKHAESVYAAMCCRGFDGRFQTAEKKKIKAPDCFYILFWLSFFILARCLNIPLALGNFLM